jgi:hypothetical protein
LGSGTLGTELSSFAACLHCAEERHDVPMVTLLWTSQLRGTRRSELILLCHFYLEIAKLQSAIKGFKGP